MSQPFDILEAARTDGTAHRYVLRLIPADVGFELGAKLAALLAGPLGGLLSSALQLKDAPAAEGVEPPSGGSPISGEAIAATLQHLGLSLRDPAFMEVVRESMPYVSVVQGDKHAPVVWGTEFAGEYGTMLEVLVSLWRKNFRSFFATGPVSALRSAVPSLAGLSLPTASTRSSPRSPVAMARK